MGAESRASRWPVAHLAVWAGLGLLVIVFLAVQIRIHRAVYGEPDSRAYLVLAKRLALGGAVATPEHDPFLHHDHAWVQTADGRLAPKFPPGYPLLLVPFYWLGGDNGMLWASPTLAALALVGAFVLFRSWMSPVAALLAVAALGSDGFVLCFGGYVLSHAADLCVVVWGMACLWRWVRSGHVGWGIGAGLLLGFAVLIRPANALLGLPLAVVWCWQAWAGWSVVGGGPHSSHLGRACSPLRAAAAKGLAALPIKLREETAKKVLRDLVLVVGAYLFMVVLLLIYQARVFGSPLMSGYSLSGESAALAWSYLPRRLPQYLDVFVRFLGVPFVVGGLGMVLFGSRLDRLLRVLWVVPLVLLYACYYWDAFWFQWLLRFVLVTFPVFYGAMFGWVDSSRSRWSKFAVMVFLVVLPSLPVPKLNKGAFDLVAFMRHPPEDNRQARARIEDLLQPDAVIFADEAGRDAFDSRKRFRVYLLNAFRKDYAPFPAPKVVEYEPRMQVSRQNEILAFYRRCDADELRTRKRETVLQFLDEGRQVVFLADARRIDAERADLAPDVVLAPMTSVMWAKASSPRELYAAERRR